LGLALVKILPRSAFPSLILEYDRENRPEPQSKTPPISSRSVTVISYFSP